MALHLQQTLDGRQEPITAPLATREAFDAPPLFTMPAAPRGSMAFDLDDDDNEPKHEAMRSARCRRMR